MSALGYLFITKLKGTLRNIFSKPLSAILTIAALCFFGFMMILAITSSKGIMVSNVSTVEEMIMMMLGYVVLLFGLMIFQKRTVLVQLNDASYLFAGPFSRKQILAYLLVDTIKGSIFYAMMSVGYLTMMMSSNGLTLSFLLFLMAMNCLLFYAVFTLITYFYFLSITHSNSKLIKITVFGVFVVLVALLALKSMMDHQFVLEAGFQAFIRDPLFYYIPLFGWVKLALMGAASQQMMSMLLGTAGVIASCVVITYLVLYVKGDFYERAISDATWYQDLRKNMKEGKNTNLNQTIKQVNHAKFYAGAKAILSKNILELRKTKSWIRKQDMFLMLFYLMIARLMNMNFVFFQYYILIVLMMSVNSDFLINELKKHFIYLIPEKPSKKIMYLLMPVIVRLVALILCALVPAIVVFRVNAIDLVSGIINLSGYALLFVGANVWSLKIMKSRNNVMVEQLLKMLVIVIAMIPAIAVTAAIAFFLKLDLPQIMLVVSIASMIINVLMGLLFIYSAKSMLEGTNMMAD